MGPVGGLYQVAAGDVTVICAFNPPECGRSYDAAAQQAERGWYSQDRAADTDTITSADFRSN